MCSQLFGLADEDEDVSPDAADPEAIGGYNSTCFNHNI